MQHLTVITTGGTIDKVYFDAKSDFQVGAPQIGAILAQLEVAFEFEVVPVLRKDSLDLTDDDRAAIRAAVERQPHRHVLITHGTDSMVETARALAGVSGKTIILTGALNPASFQGSDAVFNVGCALRRNLVAVRHTTPSAQKKSPACAGLQVAMDRCQSDEAAWFMMMLPKPVV
jgi:L-asparaginase